MRFNEETRYWIECAENARTMAETFTDPVARETMLGIADVYDGTAKQLAPRSKKSAEPAVPYSGTDDPRLWRARAAEARAQNMPRVAEAYDEMANSAEQKTLTREP